MHGGHPHCAPDLNWYECGWPKAEVPQHHLQRYSHDARWQGCGARLLDLLLEGGFVGVRERALAQVAVVVEALIQSGADRQLGAKAGLQRLAQHVRAGVPEGLRKPRSSI